MWSLIVRVKSHITSKHYAIKEGGSGVLLTDILGYFRYGSRLWWGKMATSVFPSWVSGSKSAWWRKWLKDSQGKIASTLRTESEIWVSGNWWHRKKIWVIGLDGKPKPCGILTKIDLLDMRDTKSPVRKIRNPRRSQWWLVIREPGGEWAEDSLSYLSKEVSGELHVTALQIWPIDTLVYSVQEVKN